MAKKADKPRLPNHLRPLAEKATTRHKRRSVPPHILIEGQEGGPLAFASPYAKEDQDDWEALLFQAFGTRSIPVMRYFVGTLARLVASEWDERGSKWRPAQDELDAVIAMVNSMEPRNEAQAAYAAQLCALHLSALRLAKHTTTHYADPRTVAVLNKTVRAFGDGLLNLERLQGKGRTVKQSIKSESHKHVHQHIHYHRGDADNGGKPCEPRAPTIETSATVPGEEAFGRVVRLPCHEGQAGVSAPRRAKSGRA
jgi:hypothetical protein